MGHVRFEKVQKIYPGNVMAVKEFDLEIQDKEFIVLVGPSGCGKSTTLRMVAGLEDISSGELYLDGVRINETAPKDRDVAMVFQNYALYPHMSVYDNMALGLQLRRMPKKEIHQKVYDAARLLDIETLLQRKPNALSGGQKQRVALGRAIVRHPKVFLMDEPLSNLDAKLRVQMRMEIIKLHRQLETTFIYVTHDQTEAMTMGSRIVVMKEGRIQQAASPEELYFRPVNTFVAGFIGSPPMNFIQGQVRRKGQGAAFAFGQEEIGLSAEEQRLVLERGYEGKGILLGIRPEDLTLEGRKGQKDRSQIELKEQGRSVCHGSKEAGGRWVEALVDVVEMAGSEKYVHLRLGDQRMIARARIEDACPVNARVRVGFGPEKLYFFDGETTKAIE